MRLMFAAFNIINVFPLKTSQIKLIEITELDKILKKTRRGNDTS